MPPIKMTKIDDRVPFGIKAEPPRTVLAAGQAAAIDGNLKVLPTASQLKAGADGFFALLRKVYPDYALLTGADLKAIVAADQLLSANLKLWLTYPATAQKNGVVFPNNPPQILVLRSGMRSAPLAMPATYSPVIKSKAPEVDTDYAIKPGSFTVTNDTDTSKYFSVSSSKGELVVKGVRVYRADEVDDVATAQLHAFEAVGCRVYGLSLAAFRATLKLNDTLLLASKQFAKGGDVTFPTKLLFPTDAQIELDDHSDASAHYDKLLAAKPKDQDVRAEYAAYLEEEIEVLGFMAQAPECVAEDKKVLLAQIAKDKAKVKTLRAGLAATSPKKAA